MRLYFRPALSRRRAAFVFSIFFAITFLHALCCAKIANLVFRLICLPSVDTILKGNNMENEKYESPYVEIIKVVVDQPILTASFIGEDINEWEDM
jgi:hypothetical protein